MIGSNKERSFVDGKTFCLEKKLVLVIFLLDNKEFETSNLSLILIEMINRFIVNLSFKNQTGY